MSVLIANCQYILFLLRMVSFMFSEYFNFNFAWLFNNNNTTQTSIRLLILDLLGGCKYTIYNIATKFVFTPTQ